MEDIFGLILPHASYEFSGKVAAAGYKAILGKRFETVKNHCFFAEIF